MDSRELALLEKLFGVIQVKYVTPLELSQQYDARKTFPTKASAFLQAGDAASSFAWRLQFALVAASPAA